MLSTFPELPHPLIDALMMAITAEMISIERVESSVKRFSNFSASKELPFDLEDAMVFWIDRVSTDLILTANFDFVLSFELIFI